MLASVLLLVATPVLPVAANDLSDKPCTAGDVELVGAAVVVNEPCICTPGGTFTARVAFTVRNNTNTERYCVGLHLVPDGVVLTAPLDVVLRDANGSSTAAGRTVTTMYAEIPNFPCNAGVVCFGQSGVVRGKCAPNTCTTISWNTSPGNANCTTPDQTPPGGQCRHQGVCIVTYGVKLACKTGCTPTCGGTSTLEACLTAEQSRGPFTVELTADDGSAKQTQSTVGDPSGTKCLTFTVAPNRAPATTYTVTVIDKDNCTRTATVQIPVSAATVNITPASTTVCSGVLSYSASGSQAGCTFTWTVDGQALATFLAGSTGDDARVARVSGTGNSTFEFRSLDNACHRIAVSASCSGCTATASTTVKQCVGAGQACTP